MSEHHCVGEMLPYLPVLSPAPDVPGFWILQWAALSCREYLRLVSQKQSLTLLLSGLGEMSEDVGWRGGGV